MIQRPNPTELTAKDINAAVNHYDTQLQLAQLQEENQRLRDALGNVAYGPVGSILIGACAPRKVHPGRPCVDIGFIGEETHSRAVADLSAARVLLAEGVRDREASRA